MFISYWKSALRNLHTNRLYSLISITGLALGLAAFLILSLFVREEARYDDYHSKADRLYRVTRDILTRGGALDRSLSTNSPQVAPLLLQDFPEVEQAGRLLPSSWRLSAGDATYFDEAIGFADPSFMNMFDFQWLQGDALTALERPDSVVLTQTVARKFFGSDQALGQTLEIDAQVLLTVTGVIADLPNYTHIASDMFVSMNVVPVLYGEDALDNWSNGNFHTYVLLKPGAVIESVTAGFDAFLAAHLGENASRARMHAMNIRDIHLHSGGGMKRASSVAANFYYFLVGLCILLIACVNYANLSLASSLRRIREVGIRKTMGANRSQLIVQHVGEAFLIVSLATVLALVLVELLLPVFNAFILETLQFSLLTEPQLLLAVVLIVVLVSLISSVYPAFYLSRMQPGAVLAQRHCARGGKLFSKGLVVLQFSLAILFVVTAMVMSGQMRFLRNQDPGFDIGGLIRISNDFAGNLGDRWPDFKRTLLTHPGITAVSGGTGAAFGHGVGAGTRVRVNGEVQNALFPDLVVDEDFFQTYGIKLLAGRQFAEDGRDRLSGAENDAASWHGNYILGESAARRFGWAPADALGQTVESGLNGLFVPGTVAGVVADAQFESVRREQRPMIYRQVDTARYGSDIRHIVVRLAGDSTADTLAFIDATWNRFAPEAPIQMRFVEEDFDNLYLLEIKLGQLFSFVSVLTIAIACMGLFGLAAFNTESRTKEIGIRKVMGGSVWSIVVLIASQFSRLVLVANLLAWPMAWYAMNLWLQQYAERIALTPMIFVGSGAIALCIAWVTVGGTAAKAASQKPVLALRYE